MNLQDLHKQLTGNSADAQLAQLLRRLRDAGWRVAVHNDYYLANSVFGPAVSMTFWLFTHPDGRYIKGEGRTDVEALTQIVTSELFLSRAR